MDSMDMNYDTSELMTSEFFDSVLSLEQEGLLNDLDSSGNLLNSLDDDTFFGSESSSHTDEDHSVISSSDSDKWNAPTEEPAPINEVQQIDQDLLMSLIQSNQLKVQEKKPVKLVVHNPVTKKVIVTKSYPNIKKAAYKNKQQILRVQSLSGNPRSLILPFNVKNIKIVNANTIKEQKVLQVPQEIISVSSPATVEEEPTNRYPALNLTSEEKRLLAKDGIQLPSHYPLTKNEERELKRIRRKIRNKISAQDSRKRKKEYVDGLEERVKRGSEENKFLLKRVKQLQKQNSRLMEQMSKLQALVFSSGASKATPTTCLMIVLFSALLVSLPNLGINNGKELGDQQQVAARRALLFSQQATNEEDALNMEEFLLFGKEDESDLENMPHVADSDNKTEETLKKLLSDIKSEYNIPKEKINCSNVNAEFEKLIQYCNLYGTDMQNVINNVKNFFEKEMIEVNKKDDLNSKFDYGGTINKHGFIEPDVDSDEEAVYPAKRTKLDLGEDVMSATVGTNAFAINSSQKE